MIERDVAATGHPGQFAAVAVVAGQRWHLCSSTDWVALDVSTPTGASAMLTVPREVIELALAVLEAVKRAPYDPGIDVPVRGAAT